MANPDVQYPVLGQAAAFICASNRCSAPIFKAEELPATIARVER